VAPYRVAVFTNQFPGRVSTFFARDMRALIEAGIEVEVFALYPLEAELWTYVPELLSERELPRSRVHHLTARQALAMLRPRLLVTPRVLRDVARITWSALRYGPRPVAKSLYAMLLGAAWSRDFAGRFDHVLAYWGNYPATCAYLVHRAAAPALPFTLCVHAQIDLYETPVFLREKLLHADDIVTVCEYNRAYMREHFADVWARIADRISVNYRGLDLRDYPCRIEGRAARRVLAVGRLSPEKAYDVLLRATAELARRGVEMELVIAGDGPERDSLVALASQLGVTDRVTFRGWLKPDAVREEMLEATVLAQASHIEGLPTVVEEALALGLPVVGSRVGGIPELLDQGACGTIVTPGDVAGLADALQAQLEDPELRRTFAERGRAHAEEILDMWRNGVALADQLRGNASVPALPMPEPVPTYT
jgi:colanic acid/amylovoran biosynthesis glycosyltransferase